MKRRPKDAPESCLIEAAQRDPACFAQLYEDNFERVYAFIVKRIYDREQAQDLTADVFHNALKNLGRFEWRGTPFAAWLYRARLFKLVEKLPADQRRVIAMRFAHQKSIAEIAKDIGRSEGAIKQLQFRGLQSLRTMVGER